VAREHDSDAAYKADRKNIYNTYRREQRLDWRLEWE
jgi:hypothetical protein